MENVQSAFLDDSQNLDMDKLEHFSNLKAFKMKKQLEQINKGCVKSAYRRFLDQIWDKLTKTLS